MRVLAVLAVVAALGWCGYWFIGARALDSAITSGLVAAQDAGADISTEGHVIRGFPNRFDVTFDAPRVAGEGIAWSAPFVQFFALSYRLNHLIAVFPHDQRLTVFGHEALVHSEDMRASMVAEAGRDLPLERIALVGQQLEVMVNGQTHQIDGLRAASRRIAPREHQISVLLETLIPDQPLMEREDPQRLYPRFFDVLRLDAEVEFDRAIDRHLIGGAEPRLTRLSLTGGRAAWTGTDITASGNLTPGVDGRLSGDVLVTVTGWRALVDLARAAGVMPEEHDALIVMALQGLVAPDDPERIEAGFSVRDGAVWLGPIQVGQLPALW
ncbi:DUF2125 domain-containing protein [Pararhodobacter oceanensis]|uniref:DUF2125 domain-containing protein n=1 Tax=Pararhodobacter oceanensis TaxID=2172121 RepID=UPI003A95C2EC